MGRREALIGLGGAGVGAALLSAKVSSAQTAPTLKAVVTIAGTTYTYDQATGTDLGDFVSPIGNFTQGCIRVDVSGFPLTVFFRPDRTSSRLEVVFELGRLWSGTPANLGAYTVAIYQGSNLLATLSAPAHYWFSRWRWQSAPRPVVGNVASLIQQNLLPPYDRSAVSPPPVPPPPAHPYELPSGSWIDLDILSQISSGNYSNVNALVVTTLMDEQGTTPATTSTGVTPTPALGGAATYTIMGLAGVTPYMPQTGERPDIGLITEPQAEYVCTAAQNSLTTVIAQGEAGGTMPWHMRDEKTNAPLNFNTYPKASWYPDPSVGSPHISGTTSAVTLDSSHMPGLVYLPYLLTGDSYYLEALQFQANYNWGWYNPDYRPSIPQARQGAWNIRTLAQTARVTPATVPSWMLPQSYWTAQLTTWRVFFETYVNYPRPDLAVFRACTPIGSTPDQGPTAPGGTWVSMWEDEFVAAVLGWVVAMGFTDWQDCFAWKIGSTVARTGTTSGWVRAQSTPYRTILRATASAPLVTTWADAYALTASVTQIVYTDPNTWYPSDMTYLAYTRGALVYANLQNIPGASDGLTWATGQLRAKEWPTDYKWRIGTGL